MSKLADIIDSGVVMTRQRRGAVTFSPQPQLYPSQFDTIYRQFNQQHEWNFTYYFQPFTIEMWLCTFAASLTVILVNFLAENKIIYREQPNQYCTLLTKLTSVLATPRMKIPFTSFDDML
uniref:Uncharacterized protein n=1 Tax=Strigamia maritima TaxID=126957 RepID=T1IYS4_STRMM